MQNPQCHSVVSLPAINKTPNIFHSFSDLEEYESLALKRHSMHAGILILHFSVNTKSYPPDV